MSRTPNQIAFGARVRKLREEQGHTQAHLAFQAGIARNYLGEVERGMRNIALENIMRLAGALRVKSTQLMPDS